MQGIKEKEYETLRTEMLQRFQRIFDASKYGAGGVLGIIAFQQIHGTSFDAVFVLTMLQVLVILLGLYGLNEFQRIYNAGTYLAVFSEDVGTAKWHRMSRNLGFYLKTSRGSSILRSHSWLFPFGRRWGTDSTQFSFLLIILTAVSWFWALYNIIKTKPPSDPLFLPFILLGFIAILVWMLSLGMDSYREDIEKTWIRYRKDWGTQYPDPYSCETSQGNDEVSR